MKNYNKPILEEEKVELEDVIAASSPTLQGALSDADSGVKNAGIGSAFGN